jgi:hypothetical protein
MTPKVNSPMLAEVLETVGPKISDFTSTLDAISDDIKAIEKWLLESGVRFEIEVPFGEYYGSLAEGPGVTLLWSGGDDEKTWRIYSCEKNGAWDGRAWEVTSRELRPLIETPVRVRLEAVEPLTRLVREIALRIPSERVPPPSMPPFPALR